MWRLTFAAIYTSSARRPPARLPALPLLQDAVVSARDKERRKRRAAGQALSAAVALLVPGFCLPRALGPVLPIYLQGVLQVRGGVPAGSPLWDLYGGAYKRGRYGSLWGAPALRPTPLLCPSPTWHPMHSPPFFLPACLPFFLT